MTIVTRRSFLQTTALLSGALVVGFRLDGRPAAAAEALAPNAFIRIAPDNTVTIISKHTELGQGSYTGLATILAEEMDADWAQIRVEPAPADATRYGNRLAGGVQMTGGSTSMAEAWDEMRRAGATARALLVEAAAREWGVPASEITVDGGVVSHSGSGRRATFGELASKATGLTPPAQVTLKDPKDFKLVGKRVPRVDNKPKTDGSAQFTADFTAPGLLTALVARPPRFGATVKSVDATAARRVKGVIGVVQVPTGVAVVATGFWAARKGREALRVTWDESRAERRGEELYAAYRLLAARPGKPAKRVGDTAGALRGASKIIEAVYEFPYLAHAPMEPLDAVVRIGSGGAELWAGSQAPTIDQQVVAHVAGVAPDKVRIHTLLAGGSFGRRATPDGDIASEAADVAKAIGDGKPVKVMWTREDDIRGGKYRPLYVHRLRAGLDANGTIVAWEHRIVGQSILGGTPFEAAMVKDGIDPTSVEGATNLPYDLPNLTVELHTTKVGVPVLWWRSVGSTHTAYSTETFIDELAQASGRDPLELRRALLAKHPRHLTVLNLAAEKASWNQALPAGRARGIAVHESFNSVVAQAVEVSRRPDGLPSVERVVCAVDCGTAINPDVVRAQMEGGIGFGLAAALWSEVTLVQGRVQQRNFNDYRPLRIVDMPAVEVHIVQSGEAPTGVGEPGVPPIAPAVANAFFHLSGQRVRRLPFARLSPAGTRTI